MRFARLDLHRDSQRDVARPSAGKHHAGRRAHLLHSGAIGTKSRLPRLRRVPLRPLREEARLSSRPGREAARTTRSGNPPKVRLANAATGRNRLPRFPTATGRSNGPKIDLHMTDVLGRSGRWAPIRSTPQMPARFGLTTLGTDNRITRRTSSIAPCSARWSVHLDPFSSTYGKRVPVLGSLPCQLLVLPLGADPREAARVALAGRPAGVRSTDSVTGDYTVGKRSGSPKLEEGPYVSVHGDRESA